MLQGNWQMGIIDTERGLRQMDEARKKTTKELQEESKALLEEGKRLQYERRSENRPHRAAIAA